MAAQQLHHPPPPRLNIAPLLGMQQPFDGRQPMFSPGIPPSIQQSFHPPPFQIAPPSLQTPMQPFFPPHPPNAPGRPTYQHHRGHSSVAHFPGFPPPTAIPMTPLGQGFPMVPPPFGQPFIPRNRRAPSVSIGGPPKAPLGGPGRKHSPLPPVPPPPAQKGKKVIVNLPVETIPGTEDQPSSRPPWARTPMPTTTHEEPAVLFPEVTTGYPYPPDNWRFSIPDTVDVFLPGKVRNTCLVLCVSLTCLPVRSLGMHSSSESLKKSWRNWVLNEVQAVQSLFMHHMPVLLRSVPR